jgi:hypothetical protein
MSIVNVIIVVILGIGICMYLLLGMCNMLGTRKDMQHQTYGESLRGQGHNQSDNPGGWHGK